MISPIVQAVISILEAGGKDCAKLAMRHFLDSATGLQVLTRTEMEKHATDVPFASHLLKPVGVPTLYTFRRTVRDLLSH